jgi:D-alanyl-D-alanine carboxypeptidase (penicillin-binding protein 5/6)
MLKKIIAFIVMLSFGTEVIAATPPPEIDASYAVLMEAQSGKILFEQNADTPLPPASVTKVMTLLLIYESVNDGKLKWDDEVTVSEHAASMGGSQIFLEPNEVQSVETLTKSIAIASANDAAVAMAEKIGGSEDGFVQMMNEKAKELGMKTAHFVNACGLDADGHEMSAKDIAIMSRELMVKYPDVKKYTTTWQDTITHTTAKGKT